MCHQHQKLRVIRQVFDERLAAWSTVESIVTKDFLRIATSDIQQAVFAKCHSSGTIKAGGLWLDKHARRVLLKIMSQNRILPTASNEKITTVRTEQQMDRP